MKHPASYLVYENMLLFITSQQKLLHVNDYANKSEAIVACKNKNMECIGKDTAPIARYID